MSSRLLNNRWLVLGAGVLVALVFSLLWLARATVPFVPDPEPVAAGGTGSTPGGEFTLVKLVTVDELPRYGEVDTPMAGASFVAVRFDYSGPSGTQIYCTVELLGDDRKWVNTRLASVEDLGYQSYCDGSSGRVAMFFEIPTTAVEEIRGIRIRGNDGTVILTGTVEPA